MDFKNIILGLLTVIAFASITGCNNKESGEDVKRTAKEFKIYGPEVKLYDASKSDQSIYPNHGNDQKLSTIASDYLGRSTTVLNAITKDKKFNPDYIEYQIEVDELPIDLKGFSALFSKEDRIDSKGKRENVIIEFAKKEDLGVRSQHTMIVDFSPLANSEDPTITYGYDKKSGNTKQTLHIKKLKSADFKFAGTESKYYIGSQKAFSKQMLELEYDLDSKKYFIQSDAGNSELNIDALDELYNDSKVEFSDDMKYGAIVKNLKAVQNKNIKSGGYYKLDGLLRFLPNLELNTDYPLRHLYKGEALMKNIGTSLSDGQSYVKLIMDDTQIGLLVDVDGYISQYQQVIVDKAKGIVEKVVLIRK